MKDGGAKARLTRGGFQVSAGSANWRLLRGKSLEELWDEMDLETDPDDNIPYWTELWPSSLLLADFLHAHAEEIYGQSCLDLGCGLGLCAMIGENLGGTVLAMDYSLDCLRQAARNPRLNLAPAPWWICMDWRKPALSPGKIFRIWGSDIMYEKRFAEPVMNFLEYALAPEGRAWLADPGRTTFKILLNAAQKRGWGHKILTQAAVRAPRPQASRVPVTIWEFARF